ncbi:MAG: acyl-CoA thioesterase [Acidobacteriota bacterium]|jgi:acyl-CoA thioester hydrolase|nr:acyl-CoA thioesterase [Acidobacteriota bacterium]
MVSVTVTPRFGDTDALGHINNVVLAAWFELARTDIFKVFDPELKLDKRTFPLIMAHTDYDFVDQIFFRPAVEVKVWVSRIGTKSMTLYHEAWQEGRLCSTGSAVIVHYDFNTGETTPIPEDKKALLAQHLLPEPQPAR